MELIREWIMRIAGITALGAVCDIIMPDGNMKKYVKMVVGLVLVLAVISPLTQITPEISDIKIPEITQRKAAELKNTIAEKEYQQIIMLYGEKLEKSIENKIYSDFGCESEANVSIEEKDNEAFGNITQVFITIPPEKKVDIEKIKATVSKGFGVETTNINVQIEN